MTKERQKRLEDRKLEILLAIKGEDGRLDIDNAYTELKRRTLAMAEMMQSPYEFADEQIDISMSCAILAMLFQLYSDMLEVKGD